MILIDKNSFINKRCFVIASGPSIKEMNLTVLRNEIIICVNQSYKAIDWEPDFICIGDRKLWPLIKDTYAKMSSKIICSTGMDGTCGSNYSGTNLYGLVHMNKVSDIFSYDLNSHVIKGYNIIPELVIPFVCWCGFSECYLLGCDCNNNGYFYTEYIKTSAKQKIMEKCMNAYKIISELDLPTKIYNAGIGGNLHYFPRMDLKDVI